MVSFNVYRSTASGAYVEGVCLATDEKPVVGIANGSILYAVDTTSGETTRYMYDQNSMSWIEATLPGGSGGSGGGGEGGSGEGALAVALDDNNRADKTFGEINAAMQAGRPVVIRILSQDAVDYRYVYKLADEGEGFFMLIISFVEGSFTLSRSVNENAGENDFPIFGVER